MTTPRCIWPAETILGEAPFWHVGEAALYWVDIDGKAVLRYDPTSGARTVFPQDHEIGCIIPKKAGGFVAGMDVGLAHLSSDLTTVEVFAAPEYDMPRTRFNDGQCDRRGRFWVASADRIETEPLGAIYRVNGYGEVSCVISDIIVGNGLAWSPDNRTMYFADTGRGTIYALDYDVETGNADNKRTFKQVDDRYGYPDGLSVDAEGYLWSAHWNGWRVTRYDPDGEIERVIEMPVPNVTSLTFGGLDMGSLFVTTARLELNEAQLAAAPLSGGLFVLEPGVKGLPEELFAGGAIS